MACGKPVVGMYTTGQVNTVNSSIGLIIITKGETMVRGEQGGASRGWISISWQKCDWPLPTFLLTRCHTNGPGRARYRRVDGDKAIG